MKVKQSYYLAKIERIPFVFLLSADNARF